MKHLLLPFLFSSLLLLLSTSVAISQSVGAIAFVSGISQPMDLKHCGDDRLFVAERGGKIRVINADNTLRPAPFLDITAKISSATNSEEGFLGFAFSPGYKTDGKFYVNYTSYVGPQLTSIIEEYKVSAADTNVAEPTSALQILTVSQPYSNHNGGNMAFGKDGFLYINFGDGGSGGDPQGYAQNKTTFLGKILRIDISNSSVIAPYVIPPSNPFYNDNTTPNLRKEIWAYGLRNPWRSSFDKLTGDLWIADVGQGDREEVDFQQANFAGGVNYGWNIMEGIACYEPPSGCSSGGLILPLHDYSHSVGQSITGGYVYRSVQSKALFGMYIFADYVQKWVNGLRQNSGSLSGPVTTLITKAQSTGNPVSFGEDRFGDLYILFNNNSSVYKLSDTSSTRRPKAYFTVTQNGGNYKLNGLQGRNISYQWLKDGLPISGESSPDYTVSTGGTYKLVVTNILNFSDTSDAFIFGVLPVSLVNFTAQLQSGNAVQLNWETTSEQNSSGFVVQRRINEQADFIDIASVQSAAFNGNSSIPINYNYLDRNAPGNQKLFYRLKIKNRDGTFYFSDVRMINKNRKDVGFSIYPNPARGQAIIYFDKFTKPQQLTIFDEYGKKIKLQQLKSQQAIIELNGLKGIYILQVTDSNGQESQIQKLIVL